jgi:hypothetical protein
VPRRTFQNQQDLDLLAQSQDGVVAYRQLKHFGLPPATLAYLARTGGPWQRVLPGVYLTFSGQPSWRHLVRAALLYAGDGAMVTGLAALKLYGGFKDATMVDEIHLLVPDLRRRVSRSFLRVERTTRMPRPLKVGDLLCAPIVRAVADACRFVRRKNTVRALVAAAVQADRCTVTELHRELIDGSRRGSALLREVIGEVGVGIRSAAEGDLRDLVRRGALPEPLWNVSLFTATGTFIALVDAYIEELGIVIEYNSVEFHSDLLDWEWTQERQMTLGVYGLIALPVTRRRLREDRDGLIRQFRDAIRNAHGRPLPSVVIGPPPTVSPRRHR